MVHSEAYVLQPPISDVLLRMQGGSSVYFVFNIVQ